MATPEEEQKINDILNERVGINERTLSDQQDIANVLIDQVRNIEFAKVEQAAIRSITRNLSKTAQENYTISLKELGTKKLTKKLEEDRKRIENNILNLQQLQGKELTKDANLQKSIQESLDYQVGKAKEQLEITKKLEESSLNIGNNFGVDAFQGFSSLAQKIPGLGKFSKEFADAANQARISASKGELSITAFAKGLASASKSIGPLLVLTQLVSTLFSLDKSSGEVAKNLGISYDEAIGLTEELSQSAEFSDSLFINSTNLLDAQVQISQVLGTNVKLNQDLLKSQVELTKQAGVSVETATILSTLSLATGSSTEDITKNFLGQTVALNAQNKVQVNSKQLLESISKTSKGTLATFASQPKELAKAAFQARKLGLEISTLESVADGLLDIESSLTAEFEAEVISGRQLNLERARFFALTNDLAGVGREIEAQGITQESFAKSNRIEQEALAKAVGLSRDQLGESLILRKGLAAAGMDSAEAAKKEFERLKAIGGEQYAINELGNTEYARQLASVSAQEKFVEVTNKLRDAFVSIAGPLLEIINPIVDILAPVLTGIAKTVNFIVDGFKNIVGVFTGSNKQLTKMEEIVGSIAIGLGIIKASSLAISAIESIRLIKNEGLLAVMGFQNAQAALALARESGLNTLRTIGLVIEETKLGAVIAQGVGILKNIGKIAIENAARLIGMSTALATNAAITFGVGVAVAVAAAAAGYAAIKSLTADDMVSPGSGSGGYGSRTLMGPEGKIALNNKDTVIAGTNLFPDKPQNTIREENRNTTPSINYDQLADAIAMGAEKGASRANITTNLDGSKVSDRIQAPLAVNTRKYSV